MSRETIKTRFEEKTHGLSPLHYDRTCEECVKFCSETLECNKWLKPKKRDDRACTYFAPIQRLVTPILQIVATTKSGLQPSKLDEFYRELKSLAEKSGYRVRTKVRKGFRSVEIFNPDQTFSKKLNTLLKKWEKRFQIEVKCKTEKKTIARSL